MALNFAAPSFFVKARCLLLFLALCLSFFVADGPKPARAQEVETAPPVSAGKKPLFWADGITQIEDLDDYQKLGLNTVVVHLTWATSPTGEVSSQSLAPQRAFALEAGKRGLQIIYALPAAPGGMEGAFRISADSEAYTALWTAWLQNAVVALRDTPHLIGWMLPDDPRGLAIFDDIGFGRWMNQNYANTDVVNRQWNANFESMDDVSISDVEALATAWKGDPSPSAAEIQSGQSQITRRATKNDWAFHPAALALAHYKWDAYRALLTTWVGAVRGEDSNHLIFSGRTPDYAQLLSLPAGIDIAVPDLSPGIAENDIVTHNPQSIDIARRGGKFGVLPLLSPRSAADLPASALPDLTRRWMEEACTRGARGVGFDSFENLQEVPGLSAAVSASITQLSKPDALRIWGEAPVNTLAVLVAPLADGLTAQFGTPPNRFSRGLYGFGDDLVSDEPSNLIWSLRWGTAFGGVDYLSPDDLAETTLDKYTTILAPQVLSTPNEASDQLASYVNNGGILLGDLGMGALQNGGQANALPPALSSLFGIPGGFELRPLSFNLNGIAPHPLFPGWSDMIQKRPGLSVTMGNGPDGAAFSGPTGMTYGPLTASPSASIFAMGPRIAQNLGRINRIYSTGLTINGVGRGYALFAPFRLWSNWQPGHVGFDLFFGDLTSRGATLTQAGATALVPSPVTAKFGATLFSEVINRAASISLSNHNAPGGNTQLSAIQTSSAGDWLWSGALTYLTTESTTIVGGRPAPIDAPTDLESRPRAATLYASVDAGQSKPFSIRPIAAQNLSGGPMAAQIGEESARRLRLSVWPDSTAIVASGVEWQATVGNGAPVRLTIASSPNGYQIAPRSRHRAIIVDYAKSVGKNKFATLERIAVADARGRLSLEFSGAACAVQITPFP
ncbi:hypothetical protein B1R32_10286 [Abditibacterium utsteinense]|uniref:Glycoside hydrolase family 42 N-terminal domain-containing protein n=2 Tax=Abditibacterium utsteinense TaxID=1960156 RepID=A0A2S8SWE4_9BACT|nr:hypothetical protein B1R32_10286 [Abditibacterium utsteinense]